MQDHPSGLLWFALNFLNFSNRLLKVAKGRFYVTNPSISPFSFESKRNKLEVPLFSEILQEPSRELNIFFIFHIHFNFFKQIKVYEHI